MADAVAVGTGDSPLHDACREANDDVMRSLLKYGADPESRNNSGATPEAVVPGDEKGTAAKRLFREPRGKWRAKFPCAIPEMPPQCSDAKQEVCKDFFVTVKFYWRGKGLSWSRTVSVHKMVY